MINQLSLEFTDSRQEVFKSSTTNVHGPFKKLFQSKVIHEVTNFKSLEISLIQKDNKNP
jgi:hypothetical protein